MQVAVHKTALAVASRMLKEQGGIENRASTLPSYFPEELKRNLGEISMNVQRIAIVSMLVFGSIVVSAAVQAQGESGAKTLTASEIKWGENPALPKGARSVTLMGDPTQGAYINRVQLPANMKIMAVA